MNVEFQFTAAKLEPLAGSAAFAVLELSPVITSLPSSVITPESFSEVGVELSPLCDAPD